MGRKEVKQTFQPSLKPAIKQDYKNEIKINRADDGVSKGNVGKIINLTK